MTRYVAGPDRGRVYLDGVEIHNVVECDDSIGFVIYGVTDERGLTKCKDGEFVYAIILGRVEFVRFIDPA